MTGEPAAALLAAARRRLADTGIDTAALDARLLLQAAAGLSREQLIADPDVIVGPEAAARFAAHVARRLRHEPVSRILGVREFYGRDFMVAPAVLDPRPDTETLIAAALPAMPSRCRVLDLGTGSGAIIVTLLAERTDATGVAVDISAEALRVAEANAESLGVAARLTGLRSDWFAAVRGEFDLIVSNPPYIAAGTIASLSPDVRDFDPPASLDGGDDGLDAYRRIAAGASGHLTAAGRIIVEIGEGQDGAVADFFRTAGFRLDAAQADLGQRIRVLCFARMM